MWSSGIHLSLLALLLCTSVVHCFIPFFGISPYPTGDDNWTHGSIIRRAMLDSAFDLLRSQDGCNNLASLATVRPSEIYQQISEVFRECLGTTVSAEGFFAAVLQIEAATANVDLAAATRKLPSAHFDSEQFVDGNERLLHLRTEILTAIEEGDYEAARDLTGQYFHTLQDFYSHSNWVEMGHTDPNVNLGVPGADIGPVAGPQTVTCVDCSKSLATLWLWYECEGNMVDSVNQQGLLTSGYSSGQTDSDGNSLTKPENVKCSHGGPLDGTQGISPTGGINKDTDSQILSPHHQYHSQAAQLAVQATKDFLDMIRQAKGDVHFANFLNLNIGSTLCLVIDTTGTMEDQIIDIIDSRVGSDTEPSKFILVPFSEPDFGPVLVTNAADTFKQQITQRYASGGGGQPVFCLSAVRLALIKSEPEAKVFVFTDAPAKDAELRDVVVSIANKKNIKIIFLVSDTLLRRRRSVTRKKREVGDKDTYISIAQATGGQVLEVETGEVVQTSRLLDLVVTSAQVSLLTVENVQSSVSAHTIPVDNTMSDMVIQLTAVGATLQVFNPAGELQTVGPEVQLNKVLVVRIRDVTAGDWLISVTSSGTYDLRVTAQSAVHFVNAFVTNVTDTEHFGVREIEGRPLAGEEAIIKVNLIGSDPSSVSDVTALSLLALDGSVLQTLTLQENEPLTEYLATLSALPTVRFRCRLEGRDVGSNNFQRVVPGVVVTSTSQLQGSVDPAVSSLVPAGTVNVSFTLTNSGQLGTFSVQATDDKEFVTDVFPQNVTLTEGENATVTVTLAAPSDVAFGITTTVTLTALTSSAGSFNFLIFRITVTPPYPDNIPPICEVTSQSGDCMGTDQYSCVHRTFTVTTAYSDQGFGVQSISPRTSATDYTWTVDPFSPGLENTTVNATYVGNCCNPRVEFAVSDRVGNYDICTVDLSSPPWLAWLILGSILGVLFIVMVIVCCCCVCECCGKKKTPPVGPV